MKILFVCDVLGNENNGTTIATMNQIRAFRERGAEVRVVCADAEHRGEEGYYVVDTFDLGPLNGYLAKNGVTLAKPDRAILQEAISWADAVHITVPLALGSAGAKLAEKAGKPLTASFHCQAENFTSHIFMKNSRLANHITYKVFWKNVFSRCDAVHYPTKFIRDTFERACGHKTNGYVISNGVHACFTPHTSPRPAGWEGQFVILTTGRYSKEKAQHVLIDAVARSKYADRIRLVLAGCGPLERKLKKRAEKLPVSAVFGFYSREELLAILGCADLYVHAAEIEIEAIACVEALACGLVPVIADSPRSATRAFALDERSLFKNLDVDDLAARIDYWIEHPAERAEASRRYADYAANAFEQSGCMDRTYQMIADNARRES